MSKVIKVHVDTGYVNASHTDEWESPDDWDTLSSKEQENILSECAEDYLHECCDCYAVVGESDD